MSDLSWLNPTPHAIAVYASRPLSPVATQHSLPSGRYPLLGPDFHRLDRTSLRLAHSLNHLVGALLEKPRHVQSECLGGLEVDHQLEFERRLHGKFARLRPAQNTIRIARGAAVVVNKVDAVGEQPTLLGEAAIRIYGRYAMASSMRGKLGPMRVE